MQREVDHVVARLAVEARDAGDAAGVVLEARVVEAGGAGRRIGPAGSGFRAAHGIKNTGPRAKSGAEVEQSSGRLIGPTGRV